MYNIYFIFLIEIRRKILIASNWTIRTNILFPIFLCTLIINAFTFNYFTTYLFFFERPEHIVQRRWIWRRVRSIVWPAKAESKNAMIHQVYEDPYICFTQASIIKRKKNWSLIFFLIAPGAYCPEKIKLDPSPQFSFGLRPAVEKPSDTPGIHNKLFVIEKKYLNVEYILLFKHPVHIVLKRWTWIKGLSIAWVAKDQLRNPSIHQVRNRNL